MAVATALGWCMMREEGKKTPGWDDDRMERQAATRRLVSERQTTGLVIQRKTTIDPPLCTFRSSHQHHPSQLLAVQYPPHRFLLTNIQAQPLATKHSYFTVHVSSPIASTPGLFPSTPPHLSSSTLKGSPHFLVLERRRTVWVLRSMVGLSFSPGQPHHGCKPCNPRTDPTITRSGNSGSEGARRARYATGCHMVGDLLPHACMVIKYDMVSPYVLSSYPSSLAGHLDASHWIFC